MDFIKNFPLFSIILSFVAVVLCSIFPRKVSRIITMVSNILESILGSFVLGYTLSHNGYINYQMGHFPAPYNNEIRFGVLEGLLVTIFPIIILLSLLAGIKRMEHDIQEKKEKYIYVLLNLVQVALISLIYTNDIFTGYVFLEISTLSSVGLIMIKEKGKTTIAAIRYLIFNLVGSGMFLIGCVLLYDLTGYLSMEYIMKQITLLVENKTSLPVIACTFALISIGLGIKSGMFPFYYWMPDTYGESTTTSACIVSGLISKGYIILLIKFIYRTFGWNNLYPTKLLNLIFIFGICGMILGSLDAIRQRKLNRMISFSSAAQIGYIYMGIGLGEIGMVAAIFQVICHCITKPLLFASSSGLIDASNHKDDFDSLRGAGRRNKIAGIGYLVGALSMVGIPLFGGFVTKYLFIVASLNTTLATYKCVLALIALIVSTLLNTIYFLRNLITIYDVNPQMDLTISMKENKTLSISIILFIALNIFIGVAPILVKVIEIGLSMF
jgi:multicomponent Na+:H+ antiporter subunit D